jgi:hypothetical protein
MSPILRKNQRSFGRNIFQAHRRDTRIINADKLSGITRGDLSASRLPFSEGDRPPGYKAAGVK